MSETVKDAALLPVRLERRVRLILRKVDWWFDTTVWFRVGLWTNDITGEKYNCFMAGVHEFAWKKYCGYGWKFAWETACIYWIPKRGA
jgi:hypothetical protein